MIDRTRHGDTPDREEETRHTHGQHTFEKTKTNSHLLIYPRSHPKTRCTFGPWSRKDNHPPSPGHDGYPSHLSEDADRIQSPQIVQPDDDPPPHQAASNSTHHPPARDHLSIEVHQAPVTLRPPGTSKRSPLNCYRGKVETATPPDSQRFILKHLGLSEAEAESEEQVDREVDDLFQEALADRQLAMLSTGPPNVPRILTKEDYLTLFHATGIQSSGALWGVYK